MDVKERMIEWINSRDEMAKPSLKDTDKLIEDALEYIRQLEGNLTFEKSEVSRLKADKNENTLQYHRLCGERNAYKEIVENHISSLVEEIKYNH